MVRSPKRIRLFIEEDSIYSPPRFTMLSEREVQQIYDASLEILEANVQKVDREIGIAWMKPDLVEKCIKSDKAYWPRISFGGTVGDWKRRGKDEVQLAHDRMKELLDKHEVTPPLPEDDPRIEGVFRHPWRDLRLAVRKESLP